MALKMLVLRSRLEAAQQKRASLDEKSKELEAREAELKREEGDLEQEIERSEDTEEKRAEVDEAVSAFEAAVAALENDKKAHDEAKAALDEEIAKLNEQMQALIDKQDTQAEGQEDGAEAMPTGTMNRGKDGMETRGNFFIMTRAEKERFVQRDDVGAFLRQVREYGKQNRAITGAELLIPEVVLDLIRQKVENTSKLAKHVRRVSVPGESRQNIAGAIPEAIWTEMCANINELSMAFSAVRVDGYKVGGYIAICNALLEDSDINLTTEIINTLGQAIAMAMDKAILYGTDIDMPMGIATRLAQTTKPSDYPASAPEWVDLHTSNVITIEASKKGIDLFKEIARAASKAKGKYSRGTKMWAMNESTYNTLLIEAMSITAAGAIVSGQNQTMPVIGGDIVVLSDEIIADNTIIGGYGDLYLWAERAGMKIDESQHVRFLQDQTVFRATARYDGMPVIAEGFVAIGLGAAPVMNASFAADTANP